MGTEIKYKGTTLVELEAGQTATLECAGKKMGDNVVVTASTGGSGGGLDINGVIEQYKVASGATVNAGDFVEFASNWGRKSFSSGQARYIAACKLDNSRVLVTYQDGGNSNSVTAVVLSLGVSGIVVGEPIILTTDSNQHFTATTLTDGRVLVTYCNINSTSTIAVLLTIKNITISIVSTTTVSSGNSAHPSAVSLNENKVLLVQSSYRSNRDISDAIVLSVSGTTITKGTLVTLTTQRAYYSSVVALNDDKVLVVYQDQANSNYGTAVILSISGTTITKGNTTVFNASNTEECSATALTDSKVLVTYRDYGNNSCGTAILLTVEGTSITVGASSVFKTNSVEYTYVVTLTPSKALVAFKDTGGNRYGTAIVLTVEGATISAGVPFAYSSTAVNYGSLVAFAENSVLVLYNDAIGNCVGLNVDGTAITENTESGAFCWAATSRLHNVGVAKTSGSEGEMVDVYCVGS